MKKTIHLTLVAAFLVFTSVVFADAREASCGHDPADPNGAVAVTEDKNGTAGVQPSSVYQLTVIVDGGNGTVEPNSGSYPEGTVVTLTATPDEGYCRAVWTGTENDLSYALTNTVTMAANRFVLVQFEQPHRFWVGFDYATIQEAIDAARPCDIVVVNIGMYLENISFNGKNITVTSMVPDDPCVVAATVIYGTGAGSVVTFSGSEDGSCVLDGLTITDGNTTGDGGGICGNGTQATIANCVIRDNHADGGGGGIADFNGLVTYCTITENSAVYGGGILCLYGNPTVANCTISKNTATNKGGGLFCWVPGALVSECVITENTAGGSGGGAYLADALTASQLENCLVTRNTAGEDGGGICCEWYGETMISNCTIADNTATNGYGGGLCGSYESNTIVVNSILWGNLAGSSGPQIAVTRGSEFEPRPATATISYSDIEGCQGTAYIENDGTLNWAVGNICADPCFADTSSADPNEWDYHLQSDAGRWDPDSGTWAVDANTSRCVDAGNPGTPLDNEPNDANNVRANMGAYGGTAEASKTPANWALLSDITNDGTSNFEDFAHFAAIFADVGDQLCGDFDRDGTAGFGDLGRIREDWLKETSWHK